MMGKSTTTPTLDRLLHTVALTKHKQVVHCMEQERMCLLVRIALTKYKRAADSEDHNRKRTIAARQISQLAHLTSSAHNQQRNMARALRPQCPTIRRACIIRIWPSSLARCIMCNRPTNGVSRTRTQRANILDASSVDCIAPPNLPLHYSQHMLASLRAISSTVLRRVTVRSLRPLSQTLQQWSVAYVK